MLKFFNDTAFREDIQSHSELYVYFHSPGCGPCIELHPKINKFGKTSSHLVYMISSDEAKELQEQLNVTAYPSMVLLKNKTVERAGLGAQEVTNMIEDGTSNQ
jgi:thioredoxin-like negative regulator of GroEL